MEPGQQEKDLLASFRSAAPVAQSSAQLAAERSSSNAKVVKALLSGPRMSRQDRKRAVLRAC